MNGRTSKSRMIMPEAGSSASTDLTERVAGLLQGNWIEEYGYCVPHRSTYPHLWLWDSCFHAIVWAALGDARAVRELDAVLHGQLDDGLIPHMRYGQQAPDTWLGPLSTTSSLAQPPMFGHAIRVLVDNGFMPSPESLEKARRGLDWLWNNRMTEDGLIYVVHPWEAGNDHGPRWDDWGAPGRVPEGYSRAARTQWNKDRMLDIAFASDGAAIWSSSFVAAPAAFNCYVAFNLRELAVVLADADMSDRADRLSAAIDDLLWDPEQGLWSDRAVVGGGESVRVPISDGIMGALVTDDRRKAEAALQQLDDRRRFAAPFGPTNVARDHPSYDPGTYWRGPAWPPLNYLLWLAQRRWSRHAQADRLARQTMSAATKCGWAEYWNPETGAGLGSAPQSWAGLALAIAPHPVARRGGRPEDPDR